MTEKFDYYSVLQKHFSDGLAIIVGSGLSCAEGLAGMGELANLLDSKLPTQLENGQIDEWQELSSLVHAKGLEGALMEKEPSEILDQAIASVIIEHLEPQEHSVIADVIAGKRVLRFSKLLPKIRKESSGLPVLTTNYDRLVEVACEAAGLPIDTMYDGAILGNPNAKATRESLITVTLAGSRLRKRSRDHVRVFKPHGSLDWYSSPSGPLRYSGGLGLPRLIVTPGRRKLRKGYDQPFDQHREAMNNLLKNAARLFIVGYGFNDDHLETHISTLIHQGLPTLIITRELSEKALSMATSTPSIIALDRENEDSTRMIYQGKCYSLDEAGLWDLGIFVDKVLTP